jgi:glycosyltransferase involved in cell wall biosynthesis
VIGEVVGCTVVARNHLAQAAVLAAGFLTHHPGARLHTLVIDGDAGITVPHEPRLGVVTPLGIGLDPRELQRMAGIYTVHELACAMKPHVVRYALRDADAVLYIDSDVDVLAPLDAMVARAREVGLVLTPHLAQPPAPGPHGVDVETVVLQSGQFNMGIFAAGTTAGPFLDWWAVRLARECIVAPHEARVADQRWVDLAPSYFPLEAWDDPGVNLGWWNASGRRFSRGVDGAPLVDDRPLRALHLSGHDPDRPYLLSLHAGPLPDVLLSAEPVLRDLCTDWDRRLDEAGHGALRRLSYGYSVLAGGIPYDARMRTLYREALLAAERGDLPEPPSPFAPGEADAFVAWLREPAEGPRPGAAGTIPRYLRRVHDTRDDLRRRFPGLDDDDGVPFLRWCAGDEGRAAGIPPELRPSPSQTADPSGLGEAGGLSHGVQLVHAVGRVADDDPASALVERAAARAGRSIRPTPVPPPGRVGRPVSGRPWYDVNVFVTDLLDQRRVNHLIGAPLRDGRHAIGAWRWDVDRLPEAGSEAMATVDEVWTWSEFSADAFRSAGSRPVRVLPLGVLDVPAPSGARGRLGLDGEVLVHAAADLADRTGLQDAPAIVDAHRRAFDPDEGVRLAVVVANGGRDVPELERIRAAASGRPDVHILEGLDRRTADGLLAECDCAVWLRRSSGFALEPARAMAAGRPVVALAHSAVLELMDDETGLPVPPAGEVEVGPGRAPLPESARWAVPDPDALGAAMRRALTEPGAVRALGERARARAAALRPDATAAAIARRLDEIRASRAKTPVVVTADGDPPERPVTRAARWLTEGPTQPWDAPAQPMERAARSALLRALRPYLERRGEFDAAIVQAEEESAARLDAVEKAIGATQDDLRAMEVALEGRLDDAERQFEALETVAARLTRLQSRTQDAEAALESLASAVQRLLDDAAPEGRP